MHTTFSLLLLTCAVAAHGGPERPEVSATCGEAAVLRCPAPCKPGVKYRSVIWYKVSDAPSHQLNGIVRKLLTQPNSILQKYNGSVRDIDVLGDAQSLVLPDLTLRDTGWYRCFLLAPLGHQNQEGNVYLRVHEQPIDDASESEEDSFYVVFAISLLVVSLMMFSVSYICLRNTLISHKYSKFSKDARLKKINQIKQMIVSLESKGVVSKILPQDYV
ncbi:CD83 antigen [Brachyhypopomus gauderio]|uniref:CD83 antigen n=1 Tax=Brachyhypopomus gauderio TaxID=698409 RepID=UPI00404126D5